MIFVSILYIILYSLLITIRESKANGWYSRNEFSCQLTSAMRLEPFEPRCKQSQHRDCLVISTADTRYQETRSHRSLRGRMVRSNCLPVLGHFFLDQSRRQHTSIIMANKIRVWTRRVPLLCALPLKTVVMPTSFLLRALL